MRSMDELTRQFVIEDAVWVKRMDSMKHDLDETMKLLEQGDLATKDYLVITNRATKIADRMYKLDIDHKKFLLNWTKRFRRRTIVDLLNDKFGLGL